MYTPVKTIIASKTQLTESTDLTQTLGSFIGSNAYLVVSNVGTTHVISLSAILTFVPNLALTQPVATALSALLSDLFVATYGVTTIPVQNSNGFYPNRLDVIDPLAHPNYTVHYGSVNTPGVYDNPALQGYMDDLVIVSSVDMSSYLVAVNGVFHQTSLGPDGTLYVLDGNRTVRLSGRLDLCAVDTKAIGGHQIVPLTPQNVTQGPYQGVSVITTPSSIAGKTVFAVIDGYFYHRDSNILGVIDNTHIKIRTNKLPLIKQFRHNPRTVYTPDRLGPDATQTSRKYTDPYEAVFLNTRTVPSAMLETVAFQYSRLTHFHSFLVVMNNPSLYTTTTVMTATGAPQFYQDYSHRLISGMARYGCGLCPSYLIWRDPYDRKSVFLQNQSPDIDREDTTINPVLISSVFSETDTNADAPLTFIDYVSA